MLKLKPSLEIRIRLRVLHDTIAELLKSFCPTASFNAIKKGILEQQLIEKVFIYFINEKGNKVGESIIEIDWDKHFISAKAEDKNIFNIDKNKSLNEQIDEALPIITEHVKKIGLYLNVQETQIWYSFRPEIRNNREKYEDACKYCGFLINNKNTPPNWEENHGKKISINFSPAELNELNLIITHNKE